jgi:NTP-dependent ternary system trypsin peptidase co-occuring protein
MDRISVGEINPLAGVEERGMPREVKASFAGQPDDDLSAGGVMADFVKYELDDGSEVYFESAEASLVSLRGGDAEVADAGKLGDRLSHIAAAAEQVSKELREQLAPEEIALEFGVKMSGEVGWWFFAKASGEASINVTLTWKKPAEVVDSPERILTSERADEH